MSNGLRMLVGVSLCWTAYGLVVHMPLFLKMSVILISATVYGFALWRRVIVISGGSDEKYSFHGPFSEMQEVEDVYPGVVLYDLRC